ncbi:solute:Na+ symporter, SSS family [Staphylococcus auricularis]|uniref:Solute:sodium symporter family transporter n=1 Tax=Staphylococcus auricularis TaxID=29379 RepID=A0AAP8TT82_9STAP|nr:solute:sodium symporter family transporter [Staphylococcus auricularis]MBM0867173.1 solute:sodium symporter family transporter [Staphylococcus auricularis]MCG7340863.1 solute:sodium symporter family transporter [Staphylococcus auricularis]MDC6327363.1 solute:sodium symporter family transporter [Staphylococcus auricularis]MDN4534064.1 solute:sodium symporter family transporter [Staphylococcus auricularis]PNZ67637.1 solute:sodium symporter family transporter [Staphylococcus auricularis]
MIWLSIFLFLFVVIGVSVYAYIRAKRVNTDSASGFFMGGRSLTGFTIASTIIMTNLSTEQIVGQNGQSYVVGMEVMAWEVTAAIAVVLLAWVFLPKYLRYGVSTVSEFLEIRYDTFTQRMISILFIVTYVISFLPVVLYSGSLVFNKMFHIGEYLNVSDKTAVIIIAGVIGIFGIIYLYIGGLSLSAYSDTLYGIALIVGGLAITLLGLGHLGDGHVLQGIDHVVQNTPEKLNAFGKIDSDVVPWPTLFFGMLFNNLFFWCANQMIVQKALAAKNLKESQKGAIYLSLFKVFGPIFTVIPGIIAFNMFGGNLSNSDNAFPTLLNEVLPGWAYGLFGAVIFGAILSSFVGSLNSTTTLFTMDLYKPLFAKNRSDKHIAIVGHIATVVIGVIVVCLAPVISLFPSGLYAVVQEFNGLYSIPLIVLILVGFFAKRTSSLGAKVTLVAHIVLYILLNIFLPDVHYLYFFSVLFFVDLAIILLFNHFKPSNTFDIHSNYAKVDMTPWKYRYVTGIIVLILVVICYIIFSPIGIAK